jgi:phospholipid/cholesterol/gamma-HCH transport system substrate-binding protein
MDYSKSEIVAGVFVLLGLVILAYLSVSIGGLRLGRHHRYEVAARFSNIGGLKPRAPVKIAGVTVGEVKSIRLADYFAEVVIGVDHEVALPRDTIASISTAGLLGESFVSLSPGAADDDLRAGDHITQTEPALNVADILGRYAFGNSNPEKPSPAAPDGDRAPAAPDASAPTRNERTP